MQYLRACKHLLRAPPTRRRTSPRRAELAASCSPSGAPSSAQTGVGAYAIFEELDLTLTQVKALCALSDAELTVKELAERLGLSLPGASRAVDALVDRKLIGRREDTADRRMKRLRCTDAGRAALERLDEARLAGLEKFTATLPPAQAKRLSAALRPILDDLQTQEDRMTERMRLNEGNRRWWTLAAMCFALFMVMLDNTVVNVALPSIQDDLHTSIAGLEWTVNAYTLAFGVLLVTGGRLGDIFGRRRVFLMGVVLFAASSAFIGFSQSSAWLIAGRAIQGVGAALMMPATLSIITNAFPPHERGKAIGTWAGVSALALAIGPVLGGLLVEHVSWQSIFFINLPVAAGAIAVTLFATHESRDETVVPTGRRRRHRRDHRRPDGADAGARRGQRLGLGLAADPRAVRARRRRPGRVRPRSSGASRVPMVDFGFFGSRTFLGDEHRRVHRVLLDARDVLLPHALHAERPGLLAAGGRRPLPADDADGHRRRPDRGPPDRHASARGR